MNEYDPKPRHVLPLQYAQAESRPWGVDRTSLFAGCLAPVLLLISVIAYAADSSSFLIFGATLIFMLVVVGVMFVRGEKRRVALGFLMGVGIFICLVGLLFGICFAMIR